MNHYIYKEGELESGFVAGDATVIREIIHPKNDKVALPYSLAIGSLDAGKSSLPHILDNEELYYILEGRAIVYVEEQKIEVSKGDTILIHKNKSQYVSNIGTEKLTFLCVVTPPWDASKEKILRKN